MVLLFITSNYFSNFSIYYKFYFIFCINKSEDGKKYEKVKQEEKVRDAIEQKREGW